MVAVVCTEEEITQLVHAFYTSVRRDKILGPIFEHHVDDWDSHLAKLVDFWSSLLRRTGRFAGTPMPTHIGLPGLSAELFQHWLTLFRETTAAQPNPLMREQANVLAERIARSLWYGYQLSHHPEAMPDELTHA